MRHPSRLAARASRPRVAAGTLVLCATFASAASTQTAFVDDAGRTVSTPARISRVFAAGAPADVLLYTLVPEMLVGRNRLPEGDAVAFTPDRYRTPILIRRLPEVDDPGADAELLAIKPDIYVDYGTVHPDYVAVIEAVQRRTGVPGVLLDGTLARIPETYRRLGRALGVAARGDDLATAAERLLNAYRNSLTGSPPVRVYLACSADGLQPCLTDESAGEQLAWTGGVNVAGTRASAPRRPLTIAEIAALRPQAIVLPGGADAAARLRANAAWRAVDAVAAGRVYGWPGLPYSWGPRPPSVNRLPGLMWLAYVARGRPFDAPLDADLRSFYRTFYHLELSETQMRTLLPEPSAVSIPR
jgi:iron complex transport system substrate-binding protein